MLKECVCILIGSLVAVVPSFAMTKVSAGGTNVEVVGGNVKVDIPGMKLDVKTEPKSCSEKWRDCLKDCETDDCELNCQKSQSNCEDPK